MKLTDIEKQGYSALINALGVAGTLKFLQQLGVGYGNYTEERDQHMDELTLDDFRNFVKQKQELDKKNYQSSNPDYTTIASYSSLPVNLDTN